MNCLLHDDRRIEGIQQIEQLDGTNCGIADAKGCMYCRPGCGTCVESLWRARPPGSIAVMITMDIADPFARQLMARYLANREHDLVTLKKALSQRDFRTMQIIGHNMHGSGSSYGLDIVSEIGRKFEIAAENEDKNQLESLVAQLHEFIYGLQRNSRFSSSAVAAVTSELDQPIPPHELPPGDSNSCKG